VTETETPHCRASRPALVGFKEEDAGGAQA
jgi:hypothetical protein